MLLHLRSSVLSKDGQKQALLSIQRLLSFIDIQPPETKAVFGHESIEVLVALNQGTIALDILQLPIMHPRITW